jgi:class 3 adenylate cyclase
MSEIALKYGGTIDKYIGDSVMIFFGDPETFGKNQDALNCVKMAIEMQGTMKKLSLELMNDFNLSSPLNIRVGIHSGECTVGNFGSEKRLDYTVIGRTVNLASRLESSSPVGQILVSEKTRSLINNEINCKKYDEIKVKGFKDKIGTFIPNF